MIRLHHLNKSRSLRILWLLEELQVPYELVSYKRNPETQLAPESLKQIHPLGKSPVIEIDDQVISESGAITTILIEKFAPERLRPNLDSPEYAKYLQWIEFAESSLMVPLLLEIFTQGAGIKDNVFLTNYIAKEKTNLLTYLDNELEGKLYLLGDKLSGADFMLCFSLIALERKKELDNYLNIKRYVQNLSTLESYKRAMGIEYAQA
ncbi:glutathione S-transferase [Bisgaardia hudsonensis]|uniref:glutathione transferase n=1 Tax=Bisgaardia hudsonensis TaxID=109472 RepID=A0A4R2N0T4_9PAST|nr:glutathione S-transferase [Bisgaardia hudsonensis]QLB13273.1 glutathione S-transferase [Bisgaardia hudsonensis]TCP13145.1 glutathione S-transferase [Bisgaardia hudsonensis]